MVAYLLEDNKDLNYLITNYFEKEKIEVRSFISGATLYQKLIKAEETISPTAFILDIMVIGLNGDELIEFIREKYKNSFIVMTSALTDEKTIMSCFKKGANDYLRKPFHLAELLYKIKKHNSNVSKQNELEINQWTISVSTRICSKKDGTSVKLEYKEPLLLEYLFKNQNTWVSKTELLKKIWNIKNAEEIKTKRVEVCILRIRKKLGRDVIISSRKEGYKIIG